MWSSGKRRRHSTIHMLAKHVFSTSSGYFNPFINQLFYCLSDVVSKALQGHKTPNKFDMMERELYREILKWRNETNNWIQGTRKISNKRRHP